MELAIPVVGRRFHLAKLCPCGALPKPALRTNGNVVAAANNMMATTLKVTRFIS
jgi:hypothetical protein